MNATQFTYAVARVRALEPKLLDPGDVERMLGANTARESYKILNDLSYATHIGDIEDIANFQEVITAGLADSKEVLDRICPDSRILDLLFFRYDVHNIKTILKGIRSEKNREDIEVHLLPLGRVPLEDMLRFFFEKDHGHLPLTPEYVDLIKTGIARAEKLYEDNENDPRLLDLALDQMLIQLQNQIAKEINHPFVSNFVKSTIDLTNIKTFMRVKWLKQESYFTENNRAQTLFGEGGKLPCYKFTDFLEADPNQLTQIFHGTDYSQIVQKGQEAFERFKSFVYLEKYADEYLMERAKSSRYQAFGPAALVAYFFAKQNNAHIIRMIMVGKLNGLSDEMLRERLHTLYV